MNTTQKIPVLRHTAKFYSHKTPITKRDLFIDVGSRKILKKSEPRTYCIFKTNAKLFQNFVRLEKKYF